jgi:hypothetical protein
MGDGHRRHQDLLQQPVEVALGRQRRAHVVQALQALKKVPFSI